LIPTIYIASDHNGTAARNYIIQFLSDKSARVGDITQKFPIVDIGPNEYEGKVDYPDMAEKLCMLMKDGLLKGEMSCGILICGTGSGMEIAANRFPWIRAAIATDRATAELMRQHNDANVLVLGQWRTPLGQMDEIVKAFLETNFQGGRHIPRLEKLLRLSGDR